MTAGCGFDAVFRPPGPAQITFASADTVFVLGDTLPFRVVVMAGGQRQDRPLLTLSSDNPSVASLNANGDTLDANRVGTCGIHITLLSSLIHGVAPESTLQVRVRP